MEVYRGSTVTDPYTPWRYTEAVRLQTHTHHEGIQGQCGYRPIHTMKVYRGSAVTDPYTPWRYTEAVRLETHTHREGWQRDCGYRNTSTLHGDKWSASRPYRFTPEETVPGTQWIGVEVGPSAGLGIVEKR